MRRCGDYVLPHDDLLRLRLEDGKRMINPILQQIIVCPRSIRRKPFRRNLAQIVTALLQFIAASMVEIISKESRNLSVHFLNYIIDVVIEDLKLSRVGLNCCVQRPVVVAPPRILASYKSRVDLFPS